MKALTVLLMCVFMIAAGVLVWKRIGEINQRKEYVQTVEELTNEKVIGGEKDPMGCLLSAGYTWYEEKQKCLRAWEEGCENGAWTKMACEKEGGRLVSNIDNQGKCNLNEKDLGKVQGLIEPFICCVSSSK